MRRCAAVQNCRLFHGSRRGVYAIAYQRVAAVNAFGEQSTDECKLLRDERELVSFCASMASSTRASARVWKLGAPLTEATLQTLLCVAGERQQTELLRRRVEAAQAELRHAMVDLAMLEERSNARMVGPPNKKLELIGDDGR